MIDIDTKRRLRQARGFFAVMSLLSVIAAVYGTSESTVPFVALVLNAVVWVVLMVEYTAELRLLSLQDKQ